MICYFSYLFTYVCIDLSAAFLYNKLHKNNGWSAVVLLCVSMPALLIVGAIPKHSVSAY